MTASRAAQARGSAWEPGFALGVGFLLLALGVALYIGFVPGFGAASTLFAAVLVVSGVLLIAGGAYVRSALRAPRPVPSVAATPRPASASRNPDPTHPVVEADDDYAAPSGYIVPVDLDDEPPFLARPEDATRPFAARARGTGAAAEAVRRSARANDEYPPPVHPMSGSIAFAPVIQSSSRAPAPLPEAVVGPGIEPGSPFSGGPASPRRTESPLDDPPLSVPPPPPTRAILSSARSGAVAATLAQVPQAPDRARWNAASNRRCTSCDTAIAADLNVPLCWGCGRVLCTSCYWRNGSGVAAHRCPECAARAGSAGGATGGPVPGISQARPGPRAASTRAAPTTDARSSR
ncbi:MAG: hypothetical protein L3K15_02520 [Thermoplasmata archaeon]|nr:hypothetical protein [Thermoplasmata archaeon]